MADKVRILGIAGSLRERPYNRAALRAAQKFVPSHGTIDIFDLTAIPVFNQDQERTPPLIVVDLKILDSKRRRDPAVDSRIQLLDLGRAENERSDSVVAAGTGEVDSALAARAGSALGGITDCATGAPGCRCLPFKQQRHSRLRRPLWCAHAC